MGLVTINTGTGLATDVNPGVLGTAIQGMAFERDGRLFGVAGSGVYEIDRTTGVQRDTGIDLGDSRGATLLPRSYRLMMGAASGGSGQRFVLDTATMEITNVFGSAGATAGFVGLPNADIYHLSGITLFRMDAGNASTTAVGLLPALCRDLAWDGTQLYGVITNQLHQIDKAPPNRQGHGGNLRRGAHGIRKHHRSRRTRNLDVRLGYGPRTAPRQQRDRCRRRRQRRDSRNLGHRRPRASTRRHAPRFR